MPQIALSAKLPMIIPFLKGGSHGLSQRFGPIKTPRTRSKMRIRFLAGHRNMGKSGYLGRFGLRYVRPN